MKAIMTLEKALERIAELEKENEELRDKVDYLMHNPVPGRRRHDAKWQESYNDFVMHYESGMSIMEIVDLGRISRRTAYRYKEYYEKINGLRD